MMVPTMTSRFLPLVLVSILRAQPVAPEVTVTKDVMVTMRDGIKLATDLYRPAGSEGKLAVLMTRTPYNKDAAAGEARAYAASGYVVVVWGPERAAGARLTWARDHGRPQRRCAAAPTRL